MPELMEKLLSTANRARTAGWLKASPQESEASTTQFDPIMLAAMVAFGFVFIHPFMDGNGRIHRYLLHHILAQARTVSEDLPQEIDFLLGFDLARKLLNQQLDWPGNTLGLFIRLVQQNEGRLSATKRQSHFDWMTDEELEASERLVRQAFED
ncbi:MAG: Fic family protein [Wenzhouxiangella sp.]|nr:Fic family protein [Wenzhouxiangella sp.]